MGAPMRRPIVFVNQGRVTKSSPASLMALQRHCSVPECGETVYKNALRSGLCRGHYTHAYETKASTTVLALKERCCVPRCPHLVYAKARVRGCCRRHYDAMFAAHPASRGATHSLSYDYTSVSSASYSRSEAPSTTACLSDDEDDDSETRPGSDPSLH